QIVRRRLRLVAAEAGLEVGLVVDGLVRGEDLVLPLAVAHVVRIFGAPAGALLHHRVGDELVFDEPAIGVLLGIAVGAELGRVLQHGDRGALRQRLPLLGGLDRGRRREVLAVLLVVGAVERPVHHALVVARRERNLVAAR